MLCVLLWSSIVVLLAVILAVLLSKNLRRQPRKDDEATLYKDEKRLSLTIYLPSKQNLIAALSAKDCPNLLPDPIRIPLSGMLGLIIRSIRHVSLKIGASTPRYSIANQLSIILNSYYQVSERADEPNGCVRW